MLVALLVGLFGLALFAFVVCGFLFLVVWFACLLFDCLILVFAGLGCFCFYGLL